MLGKRWLERLIGSKLWVIDHSVLKRVRPPSHSLMSRGHSIGKIVTVKIAVMDTRDELIKLFKTRDELIKLFKNMLSPAR